MASTLTSLHYHLVFATKNREPLISREWSEKLYDYLGGSVRGLGGVSDRIGGMPDHVHLLVGLKATHCLSDFMRELKKASSKWIRENGHGRDFQWQEGYGAFSVSYSAKEAVEDYIKRQEEHHRIKTFRDEFVSLLKKSGIVFDERYLE